VKIDELIGGEAVERPAVLYMGQDYLFAQASFDELDDILNTGREVRRCLGQAIADRRLHHQAGYQARNSDVLLEFSHTPGRRRATRIQYEHFDKFHLNSLLYCTV
jgi:hypothetical protein